MVTGLIALALAGCGSGGTGQGGQGAGGEGAASTATTAASPATARWAAMMVPHHQAGVEMARMAAEKAGTPGVRDVATQAMRNQEAEIPAVTGNRAGWRSGGDAHLSSRFSSSTSSR